MTLLPQSVLLLAKEKKGGGVGTTRDTALILGSILWLGTSSSQDTDAEAEFTGYNMQHHYWVNIYAYYLI